MISTYKDLQNRESNQNPCYVDRVKLVTALQEMALKIEASKIDYLAGSREGKSKHLRYSTSHQQIPLFRVSN